jgi:hypothetical protein
MFQKPQSLFSVVQPSPPHLVRFVLQANNRRRRRQNVIIKVSCFSPSTKYKVIDPGIRRWYRVHGIRIKGRYNNRSSSYKRAVIVSHVWLFYTSVYINFLFLLLLGRENLWFETTFEMESHKSSIRATHVG